VSDFTNSKPFTCLLAEMASGHPKLVHSSLWPTREEYLWLLREEACHRGLLFNAKEIDGPSDIDDIDVDGEVYPPSTKNLTADEWLDAVVHQEKDAEVSFSKSQDSGFVGVLEPKKRLALLQTYAWLHLEGIQGNVTGKLLERGGAIAQGGGSIDAVLQNISMLWTMRIDQSDRRKPLQARIGICSDIPQEKIVIEHVNVGFGITLLDFTKQIAGLGLVRYLTKKYHPNLVQTLFNDDEKVYHHPYPTAIDPSDPSYPAGIYPIDRNYVEPGHGWYTARNDIAHAKVKIDWYDEKDNGWNVQVVSRNNLDSLNRAKEWKPVNTDEELKSVLRLTCTTDIQIFFRHKSVEDRMDLVKRHQERERLEVEKTGGHYTNFFLERHMDEFYPEGKAKGNSS
jgi:hypothetical protein